MRDLREAEVWIFDLDNTLYPAKCNLFDQVDIRMGSYISDLLSLSREEARAIQKKYFRDHGTTLRGLMLHHGVDPHHFLDYVHDIDYSRVPADPLLDDALIRLSARKIVFTNGTRRHAERVLDRLGLGRHIEDVFDIADADFVPKPNVEPYRMMTERHRVNPSRAVMVEDIAKNLIEPAAMGMTTVWVRTDHAWSGDGNHEIPIDYETEDLPGWLGEVVGTAV